MAPGPGPTEWVYRGSSAGWWAGWGGIFVVLSMLGQYGTDALVGFPNQAGILWLEVDLALLLPALGLAVFTYASLWPQPIGGLGLRPDAVVLDYGMRQLEVPISRLHLVGNRLFILPKRTAFSGAHSLSNEQAARLRWVVRGVPA